MEAERKQRVLGDAKPLKDFISCIRVCTYLIAGGNLNKLAGVLSSVCNCAVHNNHHEKKKKRTKSITLEKHLIYDKF